MIKWFILVMVLGISVAQAQTSLYKLSPLKAETSFSRKQEIYSFEIILMNSSTNTKEYEPMFKFPLKEENDLNKKADLSQYLINKKIRVKLKPRESTKVRLDFKIPESIKGSLYLRYGFVEVNSKPGGLKFKIGEIGLMGVTIAGTIEQKLKLEETKYTIEPNQLNASFLFKNVGNSYIKKLTGQYTLVKNGKIVMKKEVIPSDDLFFPQGLTKKLNLFARHNLPKGEYQGKFILADNEGTFVEIIPVTVNLK